MLQSENVKRIFKSNEGLSFEQAFEQFIYNDTHMIYMIYNTARQQAILNKTHCNKNMKK